MAEVKQEQPTLETPPVVNAMDVPPKPYDIYSQPTIFVKLGDKEDAPQFRFHRALATHHSMWFRDRVPVAAATRSPHQFTIYGVAKETFTIFVDWLYKQALEPVTEWPSLYDAYTNDFHDEDITDVYVFAHEYSIVGLKTAVLELAVTWFDKIAPHHSAIKKAVASLPMESPFLQLLVDASCINGDPEDFDPEYSSDASGNSSTDKAILPSSFLVRVAKKYAEIAKDTVKDMTLRKADYESGAGSTRELSVRRRIISD